MTAIHPVEPAHSKNAATPSDQLLPWASYYSAEAFESERQQLFYPAWHCVGIVDDLPDNGDYITVQWLDQSLLIQRQQGKLRAFFNVCPHRNSQLTNHPRGNMPVLKCGYHGWEFDADGVLCKMPSGGYFKPMQRGSLKLDSVRLACLGRLIFITLDPIAPSLEAFLGSNMVNRLAAAFGETMLPIDDWRVDYDCNWKVLMENTLEDYHVSAVHQATVGNTAPYTQIQHDFDRYSIGYENRSPGFSTATMRWLHDRMQSTAELTYRQYVSLPMLVYAITPLTSHLHLLEPTSPTTCSSRVILFMPRAKTSLAGRALRRVLQGKVSALSRAFVEEDRAICAQIQQGIKNARFAGTLGAREERVQRFQHYVTTQLTNKIENAIVDIQ
jgi:choline monooxygenase